MAKLIPPSFTNDASSRNAERRFFHTLRSSNGEAWTVFHSVWNRNHEFKTVSESDFLFLSKRGMLSIEVKGGIVSTRDKQWFFAPLSSGVAGKPKNESPMDQARGSLFAIQKHIIDRYPEMKEAMLNVPSSHGCYFPDTDFIGFEGCSDWPRVMVWDAARAAEQPERVVERMIEFAESEFDRIGRKRREFTSSELDLICKSIAPEYIGVPSHAASRTADQVELRKLYDDKLSALAAVLDNERLIVNGVAGSGKTLLAMALARIFRKEYPELKVALVCYNKLLADFLKSEMSDLPVSDSLFVGTANALLNEKFNLPHETIIDPAALGRVADLLSNSPVNASFDLLIVDEGQDFQANPPMVEFLNRLLKKGFVDGRCVWFQDLNQQVLRPKISDDQNYMRNYSLFSLKENVRNPKSIAQFAKLVGKDDVMVIRREELGSRVSQMFSKLDVASRKGALGRLLEQLFSNKFAPEDIVLLRYDNSLTDCLDGVTSLCGYSIEDANYGMRTGFVRRTTVRKFKGMESRVVVVYDIHPDGVLSKPLMYVGSTRSQHLLGLVCSEDAFDKLSDLSISG